MNEIITIDGVRTKLQRPDLDGDGVYDEIETVTQKIDAGIQPILQPSELSESLKELNQDIIDYGSRQSGIDLRARLHPFEVQSVLALDALVALGILPTRTLAFSRQKKRLSVSIQGKGREEIVSLVAGKRELEAKTGIAGFGDRVKNFMGFGNNQ